MTDEEFEAIWAKAKENDKLEFSVLLDLWASLSVKEKEDFVIEQERLEQSGIWEDLASEDNADDKEGYSITQRRYLQEYSTILKRLREQGRI